MSGICSHFLRAAPGYCYLAGSTSSKFRGFFLGLDDMALWPEMLLADYCGEDGSMNA